WLGAEIEAGRIEPPPEDEPSPGVTVSLGEAGDVDLEELARMAGGLAGTGFAQDQVADVLPPGPVLGALTARAVEDVRSLPDDELLSVVLAARRQQARAEYEELVAVAEFTRRRDQQYQASKARGDKPRHRDGEFAAEELGAELTCSHYAAGKRIELGDDLSRRLPCTFAGMAAGIIDGYRAKIIHEFTRFLSDEQAAEADQILAAAAPGMAPAELKKKAARLEMRLDPDGVRQRKEEAARKHRRVEARQEASGNAWLAGRELAVDDALTAKNSVWAEAAALCNAGLDVPLPALTNIIVSAGTLLGWSDAPAEVSGFGLLDPDAARDLIAAASWHPRTRWCVTVTGKDGEAIAHGCASGQHPWTPPPGGRDGPANPRDGTARAGPDDNQRAQLAALLRQLKITPVPIAKGTCDHAQREDRYRPSRKLSHLIRARTTTCPAPGCGAQAIYSEIDHTTPYPAGATDQCNLSPPCSRHHHAKHAPGWELRQPEPGVMQWRLPSGRVHTTRPTRYDE
ncbi:MAG TPA: DUF222 domain-containing protein, partial [Trebonia sp.]